MRRIPCLLLALAAALAAGSEARAAEHFVDGANGSDAGAGTAGDPFATVGRGLDEAQPGDTVTVLAGTYAEAIDTVRDGAQDAPITLRAAAPRAVVIQAPGNVVHVAHAWHVIEGVVIDGEHGAGRPVQVETPATGLVLRDVEIKNGGNNCIDLDSPDGVLVERASIHHCLLWDASQNAPADAHGITGTGPTNLTVRDTEIYYVSGDAIQISPPREFWDNVLVERTTMWTGPLPDAAGAFPAGMVVGENAFDSKTPASGPRSRVTFRNVVAHGWSGFITNQGAFNLKENVEAVLDGVTVHGSDIGFRVRGPALVTIRNAVVYGNTKSVRYEDAIADLRLQNVTFADAVPFENGGGGGLGPGFVLANGLFTGAALPAEAMGVASNLLATAEDFVNAAADDYHLLPGASPVDRGEALSDVLTDRDGVPRPFGPAYDVGAYEWTDMPIEMDGGTPTGSGTSGSGGAGGAGGGSGEAGDDGGCGCRLTATAPAPAGWLLLGVAAVYGAAARRRRRMQPASRHAA